MRLRALVAGLCLIGALTSPVGAEDEREPLSPDRPGEGTGTTTVAPGEVLFEIGVTVEREVGATEDVTTTPASLRIGIGPRLEFRLDSDFLTFSGADSGLSDTSVGFKWNFARNDKSSFGLLATVLIPSGAAAFRSPDAVPSAILLADFDLGNDMGLNLNAGWSSEIDEATGTHFSQMFYAAGVTFPFSKKLSGFVELSGVTPDAIGGVNRTNGNIGLFYLANPDTQFDISYLKGLSGGGTDYNLSAGIARRF